jgi:hypothetical protein
MPRRPASVTQADIARMIRAAQQCGLTITRLVVRSDGVAVETSAAGATDAAGRGKEQAGEDRAPAVAQTDYRQRYYDELGFDPKTMDHSDMMRLQQEAHVRWKVDFVKTALGKRERDALRQFAGQQVGKLVAWKSIKGLGINTAQRLEARGFIEIRHRANEPARLDGYILTISGSEAAWTLRELDVEEKDFVDRSR